jgi:hypothetical protein
MNDLTDVELQTCGARQTDQESKLSAFFAKMEEFFASPSSPSYKIAWYSTSTYFAAKRRRRRGGKKACGAGCAFRT